MHDTRANLLLSQNVHRGSFSVFISRPTCFHTRPAALEYGGLTYGAGYVCETYVNNEEHMQYNFYFSKVDNYEGLVRWDRVDLNTKQTDTQIVMRLMKGVNNGNAFTPTGVKMSMEEVEKMFS